MRDAVAVLALIFSFEHDPFGKPVPTFPDHALVSFELDLFSDHALDAERAAQIIATP
jgi:hypothetical protein